jgi:hypothetical protein
MSEKNPVATLEADPTPLGAIGQDGVLNPQEGANQEEFLALEQEFAAKYQAACNSETAILKAKLKASVAAHRLGVVANKLQPLVGEGQWTAYVEGRGMAIRTVQRAMRIARCMGEEKVSKLTLTEADDTAAAMEAVERGNVKSVDEWRQAKKKLADLRAALDKEESDADRELAEYQKKLDAEGEKKRAELAEEVRTAKQVALQRVEAEAKKQAKENAEVIDAEEIAADLAAEGLVKASIPAPRIDGTVTPPEFLEDAEAEVLDDQSIVVLAKRLKQIMAERRNDVTDAVEDQSIQDALNQLVKACNEDAEVVFAVVSAWAVNNLS